MIQLNKYNSGKFEKDHTGYEYFVPSKVNDLWVWEDPKLNKLIEKAAIKLGELNSFSRLVPNIDLFIQLHVTKEAVISSRIEGTKTEIDEALMDEKEIAPERKNDWIEVQNYIKSLNTAITELKLLPISSRLLKKIHKILLEGVRVNLNCQGSFVAPKTG